MAEEKSVPDPALNTKLDAALAEPKVSPVTPSFKADDFLAAKKSEKPVPPQVIKRGGVGFFTALVMSVLAAGSGAYLALFAAARPDLLRTTGIARFIPLPQSRSVVESIGVNLAPLEARISALEAEMLKLQPNPPSQAPTPSTPPVNDAASPSVPAASSPPTQVPAQTPPNVSSEATIALRNELQAIVARVSAIETKLAALDPTGTGGNLIASLQTEMTGVKAMLGSLQQQAALSLSPAATIALVGLSEAANRPGPFINEYQALAAAMPNVPEVTALESLARTGAPTLAVLEDRLMGLGPQLAAQEAAQKQEAGVLGWFKNLFSGMVKVQSASDTKGAAAQAVIGRGKDKLTAGDLSGAVNEVASIANSPATVAEWVASGRSRLDLDTKLAALRAAAGRPVVQSPPTLVLPPPATTQPVPGIVPPASNAPLPNGPAEKTQGANP